MMSDLLRRRSREELFRRPRVSMARISHLIFLISTLAFLSFSCVIAHDDYSRLVTEEVVVVVLEKTDGSNWSCDNTGKINNYDYTDGNVNAFVKGLVDILSSTLTGSLNTSTSMLVLELACEQRERLIPRILDIMAYIKVTGILTMTGSDDLADVMKHFLVPVVEIILPNAVMKKPRGPLHYMVPHERYRQFQTILTAARLFKWRAMSVTCLDDDATPTIFKQMAFENGICLLPASYSADIVQVILQEHHHPTRLNEALNKSKYNLVVSNAGPADNMAIYSSSNESSVLVMYSPNPGWVQMVNLVCSSATDLNRNIRGQNVAKLCEQYEILDQESPSIRSSLAQFILGLSFVLQTSGLSVSDAACADSNVSVECLLLRPNTTSSEPETGIVHFSESRFHIRVINNASSESSSEPEVRIDDPTLSVPITIPAAFMYKDCGNLCGFCSQCLQPSLSGTKIVTSSGDGEAFIVAFFPIHQSPPERNVCSQPNPMGYAAALVFLEEMQLFSLESNVGKAVKIQGVVFDSCGLASRVSSIIHQLETCASAFQEEIDGSLVWKTFEPSSIMAYVDGMTDIRRSDLSLITNKTIFLMNKSGYSTFENVYLLFVENVLTTLASIEWSVVNVVVSNKQPYLEMAAYLKSSLLVQTFCLVEEMVLSSDVNTSFQEVVSSMNKSLAYLLLTDAEDTRVLLQHLQTAAENQNKKLSYIFTPWNKILKDLNVVQTSSDVNIVFSPATRLGSNHLLDSLVSLMLTKVTPWRKDFIGYNTVDTLTGGRPYLALLLQGIEDLLAAVDLDVVDSTGGRTISSISSTGLDITAAYINRGSENEIAHVDKVVTRKQTFTGRKHDVCRGWCPLCNLCPTKERSQQSSLFLDGDLTITALFPLHATGVEAFRCGAVQDDNELILLAQAFMFAVDTAQIRYPALLPGLNIGALILDSCFNPFTAFQVLADFETCAVNFGGYVDKHGRLAQSKFANPKKNVAYLIEGSAEGMASVQRVLENSKYGDKILINTGHSSTHVVQENSYIAVALVHILKEIGWDKILVLAEKLPDYLSKSDSLLIEASKGKLCVLAALQFDTREFWKAKNVLEKYTGLPVVLFSSKQSSERVFDAVNRMQNVWSWVVPVVSEDWKGFPNIASFFPVGSIIIDAKSKENEDLAVFLHNVTVESNILWSVSPWFQQLWRLRFSCYFGSDTYRAPDTFLECPRSAPVSVPRHVSSTTHDVVKTVDAILHGLHAKYMNRCPQGEGICDEFAEYLLKGHLSFLPDVRFQYQGEQLAYTSNGDAIPTLSIFNKQQEGTVQVGSYFQLNLSLDVSKIRLYTPDGSETVQTLAVQCDLDCACLDLTLGHMIYPEFLEERVYKTTQGEFIQDLWAIIVLAIAAAGAFVSLVFAAYVLYKVCRGALGKRYIGLGLSLLFSLIVLYLSVIPFVFTPSEVVCGLRYLLSGVSYTLCFAVIFVKLMSLHSYKMIGLGGEISGVNQFLTVFFIVAVQIATSVQWWLFNRPTVHSRIDTFGVTKYACNFECTNFMFYHAYVMLLLCMCSIYAISVRKEKKNMREARLLLACSWTCLAVWLAWLLCLFFFDRKWSDIIVSAAILACATSIIFIVFIPKIRMVSRLRYDLSQKVNLRNGYSIDTDFLYERPYSLPGTLTSTFSSGKMNYPKTFSNFDSDANY